MGEHPIDAKKEGVPMAKPLLRAEGIIYDKDFTRILVQCDKEESFFRFPGGGVEFGENYILISIKRPIIY